MSWRAHQVPLIQYIQKNLIFERRILLTAAFDGPEPVGRGSDSSVLASVSIRDELSSVFPAVPFNQMC